MLRLVARSGGRIRTFPFPTRAAVLGAGAGNDLVLPFAGVSRRHARLQPLGRDLLLVDLGSKNGLVCGGQRLPQALLACGGEICLGTATLTLEETATSDTELGVALAGQAESSAAPPTTATGAVTPPPRSVRAAEKPHPDAGHLHGALHLSQSPSGCDHRASLDSGLLIDHFVEIPDERGVAPTPGGDELLMAPRGHRRDKVVIAHLRHDLIHVREVLLERNVVIARLDDT